MGINGDLYNLLLVLHLVAVVVGFGTVFLNGVYAAKAKQRGGAEGSAVAGTNFQVTRMAEWFIYAVFPLGILLVLASDSVWAFDQLWISASMGLYIVGLGVSHAVLLPAHRQMTEASADDDAAQVAAVERRAAVAGGALNLLVVVIIALMVWKPGA